jgi:hypothetical protein
MLTDLPIKIVSLWVSQAFATCTMHPVRDLVCRRYGAAMIIDLGGLQRYPPSLATKLNNLRGWCQLDDAM